MLFANTSFLQRFGPPRCQTEFSTAWTRLSEAKQAAKHSYSSNILQVANLAALALTSVSCAWCVLTCDVLAHFTAMQGGKVHEARMDVHEFLWPLFKKARAGTAQSAANILSKVHHCKILCSKAMSDFQWSVYGIVVHVCTVYWSLLQQQFVVMGAEFASESSICADIW